MNKNTKVEKDHMIFWGWLVLDAWGGMKLSRGETKLDPGERAMRLAVKVPTAIFNVPSLRATVVVPDSTQPLQIAAETVADIENIMRAGTGMDITVTVERLGSQP